MKELGEFIVVSLIVIGLVIVIASAIYTADQLGHDRVCRDNRYPDAIKIRTLGWYCVGISESGIPFLVEFNEVMK